MGGLRDQQAPSAGQGAVVKNVTVAGATGAIGPAAIAALSAAGFTVQVLTRQTAISQLPEDASAPATTILHVDDYTDTKTLQRILRGQDAVISTLGDSAGAVAAQEALIRAAAEAGVKRFVPSEFGSDTMNMRVAAMPFFAGKIKHQKLLRELSKRFPEFSYSVIITGPFLDWGLSVVPFIINVGTRSAEVFDGGDVPFSTTRVSTLGTALVAALRDPQTFAATANRTLYVHDAVITQNQLIARAEHILQSTSSQNNRDQIQYTFPAPKAFTKKHISTRALEEQAWEAFHRERNGIAATTTDMGPEWVFAFINLSIWSGEMLCRFRKTDNALLGIPALEGAKLEAVLEQEIGAAIAAFGTLQGASNGTQPMSPASAGEKAMEEGRRKLAGAGWEIGVKCAEMPASPKEHRVRS